MTGPSIEIGAVRSINPARRELRVRPAPGCAREFNGRTWIRLRLSDGTEWRCPVVSCEGPADRLRVRLGSGVPRDNVARMRGAAVLLAPEERSGPTVDDYAVGELVGLRVRQQDGADLGAIVDAYETKAHGVIEIAQPDGGQLLVPLVEDMVAEISFETGAVTLKDIARFAVRNDAADAREAHHED